MYGRRAPLEDANVRAARQAIVYARDVGPSGRYRLRCVVELPWQSARVPAVLYFRACSALPTATFRSGCSVLILATGFGPGNKTATESFFYV